MEAVVSNPPDSAEWERPKPGTDSRFSYGLEPENTADYAFLQHELYHLKSDGARPRWAMFSRRKQPRWNRNCACGSQAKAVVVAGVGSPERRFMVMVDMNALLRASSQLGPNNLTAADTF